MNYYDKWLADYDDMYLAGDFSMEDPCVAHQEDDCGCGECTANLIGCEMQGEEYD